MTGGVSGKVSIQGWILGLAVLASGVAPLSAGSTSTVTTTATTLSASGAPDFDAVAFAPLDCQAKGDVAGDAAPAPADLVGDASRPATYVAHDAAFLYLRFRVSGNPTGDKGFAPYSWVALLQVPSGNAFRHQFQLSLNGAGASDDFGNSGLQQGDTIEIWQNASAQNVSFDPLYDDAADSRLFAQRYDYIGPGTDGTLPLARISLTNDGSAFGGDPDYFVEFAVPISVLVAKGVISGPTDLDGTLFFPATSAHPNRYDKDSLDCRFGPATNLAVTTTVVPAAVPAGGSANVSFTIFARNNGAAPAKGVVIKDSSFAGYLGNFGVAVWSDDPTVTWTIVSTNPLEVDVPILPPGKLVRVDVGTDARPSCSDVAATNVVGASATNADAAGAIGNLGIGPAGSEVCDGRDNDCNGLIDGVAGLCDDGCVCTSDSCDLVQGCVHSPVAFACMSGDVCTPLGPNGGPISAGALAVSIDANKDVTVVFTQSVDVNDNSYGTNIVKWPRSHVLNDLVGSDKAQFVFRNAAGAVVFDFNLDYISTKSGTPSGYASVGVASGDGRVNSGQAAWLLDWQTSLAENLNTSGYCTGGSCTASGVNLLVNSPPTIPPNTGYGLPAAFNKWKFPIEYRVKVSHLAFGAAGFGSVFVPTVHNSPPKIGANTTTLATCPTGACGCFGGCDDGNSCTTDACAGGQCQHTPIACDDGNPCTADACANGQCQHPPVTCDDGNPCSTDSCDALTGQCSNVLHTGPCSDGSACTTGDTCTTGACVGTPLPNGTSCDDGTVCDGRESCLGGVCEPGTALVCDDGCFSTQDGCDPSTGCFHTGPCDPVGACTVPYPFASSNPLTSVIFNESEVLRGFTATVDAECMPDQIRLWYNDEHALTLGVRRVVVKTAGGTTTTDYPISPLLSNPGAAIDPQVGTAAITGDQAGTDTSGRPMFPVLYVTDITANPTSLAGDWQYGGTAILPHAVFGTWKGAVRTVDKTVSPVLVTVTPDPDPAKNDWNLGAGDTPPPGLPNEGFGSEARWDASRLDLIAGHRYRFYFMVHDGDQNKVGGDSGQGCAQVRTALRCDQPCVTAADCVDQDTCNGLETCVNGTCRTGTSLNCDDNNPCTDDSCLPASGCKHVANVTSCNDGNACTTSDTCANGACVGGPAPNCTDSNPCTDDSCAPATGCINGNNTKPCIDGNACTVGDTCGGGACHPGVGALGCNDSNPCTDDACDPATGCVYANNETPCNDGNACSLGDSCGGGTCHAGAGAPECNDDNLCTDDSCSPATGCVNASNTRPCNDGDACTVGDTCGGGTCHSGASVLACNDNNPCTNDSCDPATGCVNTNNQSPCSDGDACTVGDTCGEGICHAGSGTLGCDDDNSCTDDSCAPATGCVNAANANPCTDGNRCTVGDTCGGGICHAGQSALDCNDGNVCTDDSCDPATGCEHANKTTPCSDGDACTTGDTCGGGECQTGLGALDCNDDNPCTDDSCDPATGCVYANNETPCDDGNACTIGDTCGGGSCHAGVGAPECNDDNPCTDDSCAPATGCVNADNTRPCDDGNACTVGDTCGFGRCRAGSGALGCDDDNPCTDDTCSPATGCVHTINQVPCNDGNACTVGDTCGDGVCHAGDGTLGCDDDNPCTDDSCAPATGCVNAANAIPCDDGNACTVGDTCGGKICRAGQSPLDCNDGNPCTDDSCDPATGCVNANNTKPCSDGDACTVGDTCGSGTCHAGAGALGCNDNNPCTDDSCAPATGCVYTNNATPCNDGNACTVGDTCGGGSCHAGVGALGCEDGTSCTDDSCNPSTGCVHANNQTPCSDGNACTVGDTCGGGTCHAGSGALGCDDDNSCTADSCSPATGCVHANSQAPCNDGNPCTVGDACGGGICRAGSGALGCNDTNPCTDDSCSPATGCVHANNQAPCNDGNACTLGDTCGGGTCHAGAGALGCNDSNPCTDDSCNPATGCAHANNQTPCNDGNVCTLGDTCGGGTCRAGVSPLACNDNNPCTDDSCVPATGCVNVNNTRTCSDGNVCTVGDRCAIGACVGGGALNCDDMNPCTDEHCDAITGCFHSDNTASCSDDNSCSTSDTCASGVCVGGPPLDCTDGNGCTDDVCNPLSGAKTQGFYKRLCQGEHPEDAIDLSDVACVNDSVTFRSVTTIAQLCDRLNPDPGNDKCEQAEAQFMALLLNRCMLRVGNNQTVDAGCGGPDTVGAVIAHSDAILSVPSRTEDSCSIAQCEAEAINSSDESHSGVVNGPACVHAIITAPCDDGSACTLGDTCAEGACIGGAAPNCNDSNPCTDDSCAPSIGCVNVNNTNPCSDGNACTLGDTCGGGVCNAGQGALACNDGNACTDDSCNPATGCVNVNNTKPCSDANACTVGDTCGGGTCRPGSGTLGCNDNNACTDDSCSPSTGCINVNNTKPCNDGYACTGGDVCKNGTCSGDAMSPDCAEPKAVEFYRGVCAGTDPAAELSPTVLACVAQWPALQPVATISDVCHVLNPARGGDECLLAEAERMAALLNLCTGRLKADEPITSSCTGNTTVGQSLTDASQLLSNPSRTLADCARARCETVELNSGTAIGTGYLMANRTSQGVRLDWSVPPLQAGLSAPPAFRIWRRIRGAGSFVSIAVVTATQFDDASVSAGVNYEYKVTVVWP